jgi:hypothetical protein
MTDSVEIALIASIPPTLVAVGAVILGFVNKSGISGVHLTMNSRMDELLSAARAAAHDAGRREGVESEQLRMRPADASPKEKL